MPLLLLPLLLLSLAAAAGADADADRPAPLILVSMDGFRHDYLDDYPNETAPLRRLISRGAYIRRVRPTFATQTFPCHWSIVTGMYEENHGIVSNKMYDPVLNATFDKRQKDEKWWNATEPIWIVAKKQGLKTGTYFWPGSQVAFNGQRPDKWRRYSGADPFSKRISSVVDWVTKEGVQFATLYMHQPDRVGHREGPRSPQIPKTLRQLCDNITSLFEQLERAGYNDSVNVVILSDHGMSPMDKSKMANISDLLPKQRTIMDQGALFSMFVANKTATTPSYLAEKINKKAAAMKWKIRAYTRDTLPRRLRYSRHRRVPDLLVLPEEEGWRVVGNEAWNSLLTDSGGHGYDNAFSSMLVPLIGVGPGFRTGAVVDSMPQVDIYMMLCRLLRIRPGRHDGKGAQLAQLLLRNGASSAGVGAAAAVAAATVAAVAIRCLSSSA